MSKQIFYDPQKKRWKRLRRILDTSAAVGAVLLVIFVVGVLRIAADMHWASDVLTGAAVGTAVGAGLPVLLHARNPESPTNTAILPLFGGGVRGILVSRSW